MERADCDNKSQGINAALLVPIKPFSQAKTRLASILSPAQRASLSIALATSVLRSSPSLDAYVVCESDDIELWSTKLGLRCLRSDVRGINRSLNVAVKRLITMGYQHVVVAHSDLPMVHDLSVFVSAGKLTIVPDRHRLGTNLVSLPTQSGFRFNFGKLSFPAHLKEAARVGLVTAVIEDPRIALDLDLPEDLEIAKAYGFSFEELVSQTGSKPGIGKDRSGVVQSSDLPEG